MKRQNSCGPRLGKLVHQLPGVVTFAYDLRFRHMIAHWRDLSEDYNIFDKIPWWNFATATYPKKCRLGPQNGSRSSGPEKLLKIVNCQNARKLFWASWKRWVATDIHLDQCKSYDPGKLMHQLTQTGPTWLLGIHLPRLGFWMYRTFGIPIYCKNGLQSLIVIIFLRMRVAVTSLLRDKLPPF